MKKIIIFLVLAGLAGGVFFFLKPNPMSLTTLNNTESSNDTEPEAISNDVIPGEIKKVDSETNMFVHKGYGFSVEFPKGMTATNFIEGDGEQILFQDDSKKMWFQMYVTPWDETDDISVARIRKDLPNIVIKEPQTVIIGPKQKEGIGPKALIFFSTDSGLGETREVWFVQDGNLYQITTYKRLDAVIGQILSTLAFQK